MKKSVVIAALAAFPAIGGCASMEQASLVYSSTQQMGVVVAAGKAESPAPSIVIGYNGVDVAFVPVAVAKRCQDKDSGSTGGACPGINYNVQPISGINKLSGQMLLDAQAAKQFQNEIDADSDAIKRNSDIIVDLQRQIDEKSRLDGLKKQLAALTPAAVTSSSETTAPVVSSEDIQRAATVQAEIERIEHIDTPALNAQVDSFREQNKAKATTIAANRAALRELASHKNETTGDDKADALSVYGSFDGDATGKKEGAGLTIGKIFSTGIAAQNLTQGIGKSARLTAAAQCITAVRGLLAVADPKPTSAGVDLLLASCGQPIDRE